MADFGISVARCAERHNWLAYVTPSFFKSVFHQIQFCPELLTLGTWNRPHPHFPTSR